MKNKTRKIICYTGIGSKKSGVHTNKNFLKITKKFRKDKISCYDSKGKYRCPKRKNVKGWMKWSGAVLENEEKCKKIVSNSK